MQTTDLTQLRDHDLVRGTLKLPSLVVHGDILTIPDITLKEAVLYIMDFARSAATRSSTTNKLKVYNDNDTPSHGYLLFDAINRDIHHEGVDAIFEALMNSKIPSWRGLRPVFISDAYSVVVVGRTVIYNQNWASVNVLDGSLYDTIQDVVAQYL